MSISVSSNPALRSLRSNLQALREVPVGSWFLGAALAVLLEWYIGPTLAYALGLGQIPAIFGLSLILKKPWLVPSVLLYLALIYGLPLALMARLSAGLIRRLEARLSTGVYVGLHLVLLFFLLWAWSSADDYRLLVIRLLAINILATMSLNIVNGWMGEFSVSVAGFMAVGAYVSSVLMVWGFVNDDVFGPPVFPPQLAVVAFPIVLVIAGAVTAFTALAVAIPSFRTRGDYLAIITLAYVFIVKSFFENMDFIGGPRGFMNQPEVAGFPMVFFWTVFGIWIMRNYVTSILGKATNAVRDNESAAEIMTINTRAVKITAFLTHAFWSGVAGGLYAHVIGYINPATFDIRRSAEILGMLYLGGLNSITGSLLGPVLFMSLSEVLRPFQLLKWLVIPVILIYAMIRRPRGLMGFQELRIPFLERRRIAREEAKLHGVAAD